MMLITFQKDQILSNLPEHGWKLADRLAGEGWWADEVWFLESVWRPAGFTAFLTYLVDPQWDGPRRPSEGVWAIACSRHPLEHRMAAPADLTIQVFPKWQREQPKLWRALETLRNS